MLLDAEDDAINHIVSCEKLIQQIIEIVDRDTWTGTLVLFLLKVIAREMRTFREVLAQAKRGRL